MITGLGKTFTQTSAGQTFTYEQPDWAYYTQQSLSPVLDPIGNLLNKASFGATPIIYGSAAIGGAMILLGKGLGIKALGAVFFLPVLAWYLSESKHFVSVTGSPTVERPQ